MSKLINRRVILVGLETGGYGVDPVPVAANDAVLVENISWQHEGLRMNERPAVRTSLAKLRQLFGGTLFTLTFDVEIKGSGAAGTAPEFGALLQACGMAETVNIGVDVRYKPASANHKSATIYYYEDGQLFIMTGCRGNVTWNLEAGTYGKLSFTLTGHVANPVDDPLPAPTYLDLVPPVNINVPFTVAGYGAIISALSGDLSNTLAMPPSIRATDGYGEIQITGRDINGSFDPESVDVATQDFIGDLKDGAELALATGDIGSVAGNIWSLTHLAISYREVAPGDRDGIITREVSFGAAESATDDEVEFVFK